MLESWSGVDHDFSQSGERAVKHLTVILQFYLAHTFSPAVSLSKYFTSDSSTFSLLITPTFSRRYRSKLIKSSRSFEILCYSFIATMTVLLDR